MRVLIAAGKIIYRANYRRRIGCLLTLCLLLPAAHAQFDFQTRVVMTNPASNVNQQSFLRFLNPLSATVDILVSGIDDAGLASPEGGVRIELGPFQSMQLTAQDLENGNPTKNIQGSLGDGEGKWQLTVSSTSEVQVTNSIRTPDGFLTSLDEQVPEDASGAKLVLFANPASNQQQQTFLRISNRSATSGQVTISAIDDAGNSAPGGQLSFNLGPEQSQQLTNLDLENGDPGQGLNGQLGDGEGKWRLTVTPAPGSGLVLEAMSLIRTPDGFLTNLSGVVPRQDALSTIIWFANPASETIQQAFIRLVNNNATPVNITVIGTDDAGQPAPSGNVTLTLGAGESRQMTVIDLENGNVDKGLSGALGNGTGTWQLEVSADAENIDVMSLIRTPDGFLTNVGRPVPRIANGTNEVYMFNPGSNTDQRSFLRVANTTNDIGTVIITGIDEAGLAAPGGAVAFSLGPREGKQITAQDLESGNAVLGLSGALGDGQGKWYLTVESDLDLRVFSLMDTPTGFITNLSRPSGAP